MAQLTTSNMMENSQVAATDSGEQRLDVPHAAMLIAGLSILFWSGIIALISVVL